ncbi:MAG: ATP-binding protein [Lachnospiraceae bacterium]|nr:ATP-binding protein [Lachnospiraceae bacterium]MDD7148959.1 ATP-binding protein [Lachnospiraceae bacterium]MDY4069162.1 ATP-binding protein [Lachnospiraceae bacterium]
MRLKRETYLEQIRPYYNSDIIKVITGVRRAGKSILLDTIKDELIESGVHGDHIIYLNLEDMDYDYIADASDLNKEIKSRIIHEGKYYIFLDEIQHVENFEKALASFRATLDVSLFVTGSNSTLLSGELSTLLTGRTVEFEILPFSFYEMKQYYELNRMDWSEDLFSDYLKWGGFPLRFDYKDETSVHRYLSNLYESIVNRDIVGRSKSADKKSFMDISLYILANAGKELSVDNIISAYKKDNKELSRRTIYHYLERMKKAYLIHGVGRYNIVGKSALSNREKQYAVDMGFRTINTNTINYEDTFFLENVIYNELITRGFTVFAGKTFKGEIDFVAIKGGKKCFLQVAYLLASEDTIKREFGAYSKITDASPKYVMSLDKIDLSHDGIVHINIIDFLLRRVDLMLT